MHDATNLNLAGRFTLEDVVLHSGVSGFVLFIKCCQIIAVHIALLCQGLKFILVPLVLILNHWHGSPAVGELHGKVLQIEDMIVLSLIAILIGYGLVLTGVFHQQQKINQQYLSLKRKK